LVPGGAGGGSASNGSEGTQAYTGGNSGAILILFSNSITLSAGVVANGQTPSGQNSGGVMGAGGGSGGAILMACGTATLGTNQATATAGSGGTGETGKNGGAGAAGRIAVHHSGTVTGTTNPTFDDTTDATLVELSPSGFFNFF
jgi:hypothetical protein